MSLALHNLHPARGSRKTKKRIGRGNASGHGTYSTRGQKGQRARSGGRKGLKRKGMRQLLMSLPKIGGFKSLSMRPAILNVGDLEKNFTDGAMVNPGAILAKGLVRNIGNGVKILGDGELKKKLKVSDCLVSESAKQKITAAGGAVEARSAKRKAQSEKRKA